MTDHTETQRDTPYYFGIEISIVSIAEQNCQLIALLILPTIEIAPHRPIG